LFHPDVLGHPVKDVFEIAGELGFLDCVMDAETSLTGLLSCEGLMLTLMLPVTLE
jgi:hypothetical protein